MGYNYWFSFSFPFCLQVSYVSFLKVSLVAKLEKVKIMLLEVGLLYHLALRENESKE